MNIVLPIIEIAGYMSITLYLARELYGQWRAKEIDRTASRYTFDAVKHFEERSNGDMMFGAFATAMVWPISMPIICVKRLISRFMLTTDIKSEVETMREHDAMRKRISELEKELKMTDRP
jgi:hypothetical protein